MEDKKSLKDKLKAHKEGEPDEEILELDQKQ